MANNKSQLFVWAEESCHSYLARLETLGATGARDWVELSSYNPMSVEALCVCRRTLLNLD